MFLATAAALKTKFGLTLFGFDVIIPITTHIEKLSDDVNRNCREETYYETNESHSKQARYRYSQEIDPSSPTSKESSTQVSTAESTLEDTDVDDMDREHTILSPSLEDKRIMIIDINYFPSYKEVNDFPLRLRKYLRKLSQMNK